jgi:hypothetical protein
MRAKTADRKHSDFMLAEYACGGKISKKCLINPFIGKILRELALSLRIALV